VFWMISEVFWDVPDYPGDVRECSRRYWNGPEVSRMLGKDPEHLEASRVFWKGPEHPRSAVRPFSLGGKPPRAGHTPSL
jgi:hypothetical protein